MSSEEGSLRNSTVLLLGLNEHDGFVLQVVINDQFSDSVVLKSALHDVLLAETVESQNLFIELGVHGLELLVNVDTAANVVGELIV